MKIVILLLTVFFHSVYAVYDNHVNGKIQERVSKLVKVGQENATNDNKVLSLMQQLNNSIKTHGVENIWENKQSANIMRDIIQSSQQDSEYKALAENAIQKTVEMQCSWNKAFYAFYQIVCKKMGSSSNIQLPELAENPNSDEYMKAFFEQNATVESHNYPALCATTAALFKVLQDQRNALKNVNADLLD